MYIMWNKNEQCDYVEKSKRYFRKKIFLRFVEVLQLDYV